MRHWAYVSLIKSGIWQYLVLETQHKDPRGGVKQKSSSVSEWVRVLRQRKNRIILKCAVFSIWHVVKTCGESDFLIYCKLLFYIRKINFSKHWRKRRDSNPWWGSTPHTPLAGEHLRPLGHVSSWLIMPDSVLSQRLCAEHAQPTLGISRQLPRKFWFRWWKSSEYWFPRRSRIQTSC